MTGSTSVRFTTSTLLAKTNKVIKLDADITFKDQHSHPDYTNLLNESNTATVILIHEKADILKRSTEDSATYHIHCVEHVSIKVSTQTLQATKSKRVTLSG